MPSVVRVSRARDEPNFGGFFSKHVHVVVPTGPRPCPRPRGGRSAIRGTGTAGEAAGHIGTPSTEQYSSQIRGIVQIPSRLFNAYRVTSPGVAQFTAWATRPRRSQCRGDSAADRLREIASSIFIDGTVGGAAFLPARSSHAVSHDNGGYQMTNCWHCR